MSEAANKKPSNGYIVSPWYDHLFFIWAPLMFLAMGAAIHYLDIAHEPLPFFEPLELFPVFAVSFSMAHVFAVVFRSHLNKTIFKQFPFRFTLVPLALLLGMNVSHMFLLLVGVFIVWQDVYHSSLQTFGFGRLYDRAAGNDLEMGRRLDYFMALLTYAGPIFAGVQFARHLQRFDWFSEVGINGPSAWKVFALENQSSISQGLVVVATLFTAYYLFCYWRFHKQGYKISWQKVALYVALTITSVWSWTFDSFGQAFLTMECYHAFQYFAIVWWSEKKNMRHVFGLEKIPFGVPLTFIVFFGVSMAFGFWTAVYAIGTFSTTVVFLAEGMHYWYDGFIWSVRKSQV